MGEIWRTRRKRGGLKREAAFPTPRMGLGFVIGAVISLMLLASAADGVLWKYSAERERLRTRAAHADVELSEMADELRELRRENAALRNQLLAGERTGASLHFVGGGAPAEAAWQTPRCRDQ